jgi:hypothetical protein
MNSIFAAQKLRVTIDVCKVYGEETVFLQQAAHLTGGSYIYLERRDAFLQYLTACSVRPRRSIDCDFLPPPLLDVIPSASLYAAYHGSSPARQSRLPSCLFLP